MEFGEDDPPEIIMRALDNIGEHVSKKLKGDDVTVFRYLNEVEEHIRSIFVSGIRGIKTVKTSKRLVMQPDPKDEISKKKRDGWEYIVFEA